MQFLVAIAIAFFAVTTANTIFDAIPPSTVDSLNVTAYSGRWYQTHASWIPLHTFEKDGYCITADYKLKPDSATLLLVNSMNAGNATGPLEQVSGFAFQPLSHLEPGKLVITIHDSWKGHGFYWVHALGPINPTTGLYEWSGKISL